jgi:hypothetical protein
MGRTAVLLVLGLGMAMGFIGLQIFKSGEAASATQYAYLKYMNARNLARAAVHTALRTYDRNQIPATGVATSLGGGSFELTSLVSSTDGDTLRMATRGTYAESTYAIRLRLFRTTRPFPTVNGAISIRAKGVNFTVKGNPTVDGHNYDTTGTRTGSGDLPGVSTMDGTDSASVKQAFATKGILDGTPPVDVDTTTVDPLKFLDIYRNNADFVYNTTGVFPGQTWGTPASPVIVYCNPGDDTSFAIKFTGGVTGYGILVVRGNVQFNGNLSFRGLVVVDGFNTTVTFNAGGTPAVTGGIIIAGNKDAAITLNGTGAAAKCVYSSQALRQAMNIGKLRYYTILDWYE